jgi:hypothetical protein
MRLGTAKELSSAGQNRSVQMICVYYKDSSLSPASREKF